MSAKPTVATASLLCPLEAGNFCTCWSAGDFDGSCVSDLAVLFDSCCWNRSSSISSLSDLTCSARRDSSVCLVAWSVLVSALPRNKDAMPARANVATHADAANTTQSRRDLAETDFVRSKVRCSFALATTSVRWTLRTQSLVCGGRGVSCCAGINSADELSMNSP